MSHRGPRNPDGKSETNPPLLARRYLKEEAFHGHSPFDTIAGLLLALFEHIPIAGERDSFANWHFEVMDMDGVRIEKVFIQQATAQTDRGQTEGARALRAMSPTPAQTQQPPAAADRQNTNGQE